MFRVFQPDNPCARSRGPLPFTRGVNKTRPRVSSCRIDVMLCNGTFNEPYLPCRRSLSTGSFHAHKREKLACGQSSEIDELFEVACEVGHCSTFDPLTHLFFYPFHFGTTFIAAGGPRRTFQSRCEHAKE